jgi:signal transduction histidine kinase
MDALDLDVAGLVLITPDQESLMPQTIIGLSPEFLDFVAPLQSTERSQAIRTRQPVVISDLLSEARFAHHSGLLEMVEREGVRTLAAVPVVAQDEVIGVLFVANRSPEVISSSALDLLVIVGQQFGVVLHNAQLYAQAEERAAQLQVAYRQLQDLARRKTQFVQNTSHELRTPLTFVRGYLELLLSGDLGPLTTDQQSVLEIMEIKSQRLVDLVNDIASLLEVELSPTDVEPVDLVDAVARSVMNQREQASQADIVLETEWPSIPPIVQGNRQRLTQVFEHLLDNAIKFSPNGGCIWVRAWSEHDNAFVQVTDQGIGISPEEQERIFDRFYQVDGSTTRRFGGTGLGLAIVKETIEAHGGMVQVESNGIAGEGTTFTVIVPLLQEGPSDRETKTKSA